MPIVKIDKNGRIVIPANIRKKINSNIFHIEFDGEKIILYPIESTKLTDLFDSIEIDVEDFADIHKLRKALLKGR